MTLVFDTSVLIDIERNNPIIVNKASELSKLYPLSPETTFINEFEFRMGIKERNPKNREKALVFLYNFSILHAGKNSALIMTDLRYKYDKKGLVISLADLLIASIVIENNKVLVTRDKIFEQIEELRKIIIE